MHRALLGVRAEKSRNKNKGKGNSNGKSDSKRKSRSFDSPFAALRVAQDDNKN